MASKIAWDAWAHVSANGGWYVAGALAGVNGYWALSGFNHRVVHIEQVHTKVQYYRKTEMKCKWAASRDRRQQCTEYLNELEKFTRELSRSNLDAEAESANSWGKSVSTTKIATFKEWASPMQQFGDWLLGPHSSYTTLEATAEIINGEFMVAVRKDDADGSLSWAVNERRHAKEE